MSVAVTMMMFSRDPIPHLGPEPGLGSSRALGEAATLRDPRKPLRGNPEG